MAIFTPEELEELRRADAEIDKQHNRRTAEQIKDYRRSYYQANREKILEKAKDYNRAYYRAHKAEILEKKRQIRRKQGEAKE